MVVELHNGPEPQFAGAWHDIVAILTQNRVNPSLFFSLLFLFLSLSLSGELAFSTLKMMSAIHGKLL